MTKTTNPSRQLSTARPGDRAFWSLAARAECTVLELVPGDCARIRFEERASSFQPKGHVAVVRCHTLFAEGRA